MVSKSNTSRGVVMKILTLDGQPVVNMDKTKSLTVRVHGCIYKITSSFFGLRVTREDADRISVLPQSEKEIVVK